MLVSDAVHAAVVVNSDPWDGVAVGDAPDHLVTLTVCLTQGSDAVGVGDVDGVVCTMLVKVLKGGGLNSEGGLGHVLCVVGRIVEHQAAYVKI